jgi:hypothetical protein
MVEQVVEDGQMYRKRNNKDKGIEKGGFQVGRKLHD